MLLEIVSLIFIFLFGVQVYFFYIRSIIETAIIQIRKAAKYMKKTLISVLSAVSVIFFVSIVYAHGVHSNLSGELIRLHIIANSDTDIDQALKIKIRDEIIEKAGAEFKDAKDKNELKNALIKKAPEIKKIADNVLLQNNSDYASSVSFERLYIPRKVYDGIILPEGSYEAMVVRLGEAKGKNWWCVVYPPLCFTESTCGELSDEAKEYLKNNLTPQSYSLITESGIKIEYKLKVVELYEKAKKEIFKK